MVANELHQQRPKPRRGGILVANQIHPQRLKPRRGDIFVEINLEFPATDNKEFLQFMNERGYDKLRDGNWKVFSPVSTNNYLLKIF